MGNPHAVQVVADVDTAPVDPQGPLIESHRRFPRAGQRRLHAGRRRDHAIRLRVYERGAGETLACGTGACAAVVAGIRARPARVAGACHHARRRPVDRLGRPARSPVVMTGPAVTVFEGEIDI